MAAAIGAASVAAADQPVQREILALYDGRDETAPDETRVHRYAEMPLNYFGFVVEYWDVSKGLPDDNRLAGVRGIVTWFTSPQRPELFAWLRQAMARGIRIAVLGDGGFPSDQAGQVEANLLFEQIGFRLSDATIDLTYASRIAYRDSMVGFEREPDAVLPEYPVVDLVGADVASHLKLQYADAEERIDSTVVLTSPRGGFAASGYFTYETPGTESVQWIVDPFAFFAAALGTLSGPIPDVTTASGRRIYLSQIDGDGWSNVSRIARFRDQQMISAAVVQRELIEPYPDLPVSVGLIAADADPRYGQVSAAQKTARELFALPQVEVATHTYTHPFQWPFFEHYDRRQELRALGQVDIDWLARLTMTASVVGKRLFPGFADEERHSETVIAGRDPPRAYSKFAFDLNQEIAGAVAASQKFAPPGKRTALYQWSGDADPFADAIARTRQLGVRNLNGGDSRVDPEAASVTSIAPISRPVGDQRQIYAPDANDYIFMSDDDGRDFGFLDLSRTIEATENPRRLKPIDLYYHMYVGERPAELNAVLHHLDAMRRMSIAPLAASHYAAIADGFFTTTLRQLDAMTWQVGNRGALQTVRFDDAGSLGVDFSRSIGVVGESRKGTTLYVGLDASVEDAVVALTAIGAVQQPVPYLVSARWIFSDLKRHECGFTADAQGFGEGEMAWAGLSPGKYHLQVSRSNKTVWSGDGTADATGALQFTVKADAIDPVVVDVACDG